MGNKKGALELSVGTIVIIVLAMSMLILGLVLVRSIFTGATYNVNTINDNVKAEINKLFNERGEKTVLYLPNNEAKVKKGESFGIAFSVQNNVKGEAGDSNFAYKVDATSVQTGCQLSLQEANSYIILNKEGNFNLAPGQQLNPPRIIKVQPSEAAPLCLINYDIEVTRNGQHYATNFFILVIE